MVYDCGYIARVHESRDLEGAMFLVELLDYVFLEKDHLVEIDSPVLFCPDQIELLIAELPDLKNRVFGACQVWLGRSNDL